MKLIRTGLLAVVLVAALAGCSAVGMSTFVGTWGSSAAGKPNLTLTSDGKVSGTDGCNMLAGTWQVTSGRAEFGPLATTLKACEGIDTWLAGASTASVDGSTMTVYSESGTKIGSLQKH